MSDEHIVKSYDEELQHLNDSLVQMGSLTESLLQESTNAITKVDKESVARIVKSDEQINKFRSSIDKQIMTILVKRAPVAIDLRYAISTLKISQDLERIGDLAKGNAKKILPLHLKSGISRLEGITERKKNMHIPNLIRGHLPRKKKPKKKKLVAP